MNKLYILINALKDKRNAITVPLVNKQVFNTTLTAPRTTLYRSIFFIWLCCLAWFGPRLLQLFRVAENWQGMLAIGLFIVFIGFAWLYGIYNLTIIAFGYYYRWRKAQYYRLPEQGSVNHFPQVALLYTTCNDFNEESVQSCIAQQYPAFTVYILDDSSDETYKKRVDDFAATCGPNVKVVRRANRVGYKAGNLNHALAGPASAAPYFAIADADEILPTDFLSKLVPTMELDPQCGFIQANHRANPDDKSTLAKAAGPGIDIHWKYYQPLRNEYGFVMFLGHGALLRRSCWEASGGFPDIVSEDLGYAIKIRELGYRGRFAEEVICYESFPDTVRAFRVRHIKWTRGTSEFLFKKFRELTRSKQISFTEKMDILFPTLNLPLTLVFFLFMVNANIVLPLLFGAVNRVTFVAAGTEWQMPVVTLQKGFEVIYSFDFYLITILTFLSPVLCFILALFFQPVKLYRFLSHSTALYASLAPLSTLGVLAFMVTKKASFLVTGDTKQQVMRSELPGGGLFRSLKKQCALLVAKSHPDQPLVQYFEIGMGLLLGFLCVLTFQVSCIGLAFSFILLPLLHRYTWNNRVMRVLVHIPFAAIMLGMLLMTLSAFGVQTIFFGYGFHF